MTKTFHMARPVVAFDPNNPEHRRFYADFLKSRSWGHCPVRFYVSNDTGNDLVAMIQRSLLDYYVGREFQ